MPLQTVSQDQLQQHYRFQQPTIVMSQSFPSVSVMPITPNSEIQMQAQCSQAFRKSSISPRIAKVEKENQAPLCSRFTKDETKLLVNLWEDELEGFLNKKRVKQEDWDAVTEMYNSHAVIMKLSRRTSTQLEHKIKKNSEMATKYQ